MKQVRIVACLFGLAACTVQAPIRPKEPLATINGIFEGTMGDKPFRLCLTNDETGRSGQYYTDLKRESVALTEFVKGSPNQKPEYYREWDKTTYQPAKDKYLFLESNGADGLIGYRQSDMGREPITLRPVPLKGKGKDFLSLCDDPAFNGPRLPQEKLTRVNAVMGNTPYQIITTNLGDPFGFKLSSFQLEGTSPAIMRVNAELRAKLPDSSLPFTDGNATSNDNLLFCVNRMMNSGYKENIFKDVTRPSLITQNFLTIRTEWTWDCNAAAGEYGTSWESWDLQSGKKLDLVSWFNPDAMHNVTLGKGKNSFQEPVIGPSLSNALFAIWKRNDPEFFEGLPADQWWGWEEKKYVPHLTKTGIAFSPTGYQRSFEGGETVIPFAGLQPLLSAKGKAGIAALQADLKAQNRL